ncbi:MAG: hypothetical protein CMP59_10025 [Flavobacteriales bacterium]|nr:hypothetical protein [Flavobacteriales bacterium]
MYPLARIAFLLIILLFGACEKKEKLLKSYKGIAVHYKKTNSDQLVPFVNYHPYLEKVYDPNSSTEDFVIIEFKGIKLSVNNHSDPVRFNRILVGSWELLKVYHLDGNGVAFMDYRNKYMSLHDDATIRFTEDSIGKNTLFNLTPIKGSQFAILAPNQRYISSENGKKGVTANRKKIGPWETFKIFKLLPPQ